MWIRRAMVIACACALCSTGCYESDGGVDGDAGGIMLMDSGGGGDRADTGPIGVADSSVPAPDAGTPPDAGEPGTPDAGGPRDAGDSTGTVDCMGTPCDADTESCCITGGMGGASATCIPNTEMCEGATSACDGPEDCGGGETCCLMIMGFGGMAECTSEMCGGGGGTGPGGFPSSFELCHDASDCTDTTQMCCPVSLFGFSGAYCSEMCGFGPPMMP